MALKLYRVDLTPSERDALLALTQKGRTAARKIRRAQILLLADRGQTDTTIAQALAVGVSTVERTRCKQSFGGIGQLCRRLIIDIGFEQYDLVQ